MNYTELNVERIRLESETNKNYEATREGLKGICRYVADVFPAENIYPDSQPSWYADAGRVWLLVSAPTRKPWVIIDQELVDKVFEGTLGKRDLVKLKNQIKDTWEVNSDR